MEKLDAYNTLKNMVAVFAGDEEVAAKTPFIFVIQTSDGEGCNFIGCNTTHNLGNLVQVVIDQFVGSMKEAVIEGIDARELIVDMLSKKCKLAILKNFLEEILLDFAEAFDEPNEEFDEFA